MIHDSAPANARPTLRLFTGIAIPDEVNSRLDELIRQLKPRAEIRWSPSSNFHITTKFIGYWPQDRLDEMKTALGELKGSGAFPIAVRGLGFFPNARHPRIFWTGVDGGMPLVELATRTDRVCAGLGIEPESKPYAPHLTLARIDSPGRLDGLHQAIEKLTGAAFGEFETSNFHLYLSKPGRGGSIYTSLAEFSLC